MLNDVGDHHGHVVRSAATQCQFDEPVGAFPDIGELECLEDGLVADRVGQAIGAQQVAVAHAGLAHDERRLHLVAGQRAHDQRPLRMTVCLLGGDATLVDEGLNEGVVLGDLREFTVAQQVPARVADVHQPESVTGEQDRGERGAHPLQFGVVLHLPGDG